MAQLDINKYDRMTRCIGIETLKKIQQSNVFILGLDNGFAGEICKNLALSGVKEINLIGEEILLEEFRMSSMYYINQSPGKKCSLILQDAITELNSMCNVNIIKNILDAKINNSLIVVINKTINETIKLSTMCRELNCKLVFVMGSGLAGSIFIDSITHTVTNPSGESNELIQVKNISNDSIICYNNFNLGDIIKFTFIQGTNAEYLQSNEFIVIGTSNNSIKVVSKNEGTFNLPKDFKFINGTIVALDKTVTVEHLPLNSCLDNLDPITLNLNKIFLNDKFNENKYLYTKNIYLEPVTSIIAGFASTEIIKLIGVKYIPISQWFTWEDHNLFPSYESQNIVDEYYNLLLSRLKEQNILLVGSGALGCEWLKQLAMLNCLNVDIIDPDHIEHSNLCRQFLFRSSDVKKSKCKTAINSIKKINPNMNLTGYEEYLSSKNEDFTNKVFKDKTIVINALDNVETRRYVDNICFNKLIPLFESGTMGMKANCQPIIPFITETYSMMNDSVDTKEYPVCTIKSFPNSILHTIHWARDQFEIYTRGPDNCNKYIENPDFLKKLSPSELKIAIEDINYFLEIIPETWIDCLLLAKKSFDNLFVNNINVLLKSYPKDHTIDGTLFWSQGKLCPSPLFFNPYNINIDNDCMYKYLHYTTLLLCQIYSIPIYTIEDMFEYIKENSLKFIPLEYTDITNSINIDIINITNIKKLTPQYFDKDTHTEYITSCSNNRALNYNIPIISEYETKGIVGNIIPAVATTTSTIVGLIAMEFIKNILQRDNIVYRSWFLNMALNIIVQSDPMPAPILTLGNKQINCWEKFNYNVDNKTLLNLIEYVENKFDIKVFMILFESSILYNEGDDVNILLLELFKNEYTINVKTHNVVLTIVVDTIETVIPPIILF
jgi:ubiquitin-activating enzyme E1